MRGKWGFVKAPATAIRPHHSGSRGSGCLHSCLSGSPDGSPSGASHGLVREHRLDRRHRDPHPFHFVIFLAWIFLANLFSGGAAAAWNGLTFMLLLFACVLAHEFGHIFTARAFGVPTPDVTLLPIGGVARLARIPDKPIEEFLVAI